MLLLNYKHMYTHHAAYNTSTLEKQQQMNRVTTIQFSLNPLNVILA